MKQKLRRAFAALPLASRPLCAAALLLGAGLLPGSGVAGGAPPPAPPHGDVPGIAWFAGGVAGAFATAQAKNKPVFLYWGAKWCPPCQQLKSSVFSRTDFMEKANQFVPVYLDGDEPGAQAWGERFHVSGYPTVVILRADQREITRISGGMDLSLYADLLDIALRSARPLSEVLAAMRDEQAALSPGDCQRLAYYAWDLADVAAADRGDLARGLERAAATCSSAGSHETARMRVAAEIMDPTVERAGSVIDIVEDPARSRRIVDALESLDNVFFDAVQARGPQVVAPFLAAWARTMELVAGDPTVIPADQLSALDAELRALKRLSADGTVPRSAATAARTRLAAVLGRTYDPYVRSGIVNAASSIDETLGDEDAEFAMLKTELETSKTPFYYMIDLGAAEEKRGHAVQALDWYARAYTESSGVATRFQWGAQYLSALLRLAPEDHVRIRKVGVEVIAELDGPDRIHARTRASLAKLEAGLKVWNAKHAHDADLRALQARLGRVCMRQLHDAADRDSCRRVLG